MPGQAGGTTPAAEHDAAVATARVAEPSAPAGGGLALGVSTATELEKLAALHEAGHLTADEFQAAKQKVLAALYI